MKFIWKAIKAILMTLGLLWLVLFGIALAVGYTSAPEYGPEGTISVVY